MGSRPAVVSVVLAILVAAVFGRTVTHDFINYDDNVYVYDNPSVTGGLSLRAVGWALTTTRGGAWSPLTWLSHLLDVSLFGLRPWGHHAMNALLHAANVILLFLVLRAGTGSFWRSGLVAALFAVHPLHVQSVAWVAERKDLLSTLLGLATIASYLGGVRRPSRGGRLRTTGLFALALMAKPMLVTLPVLLLLLDWWPLGRLVPSPPAPGRPKGLTSRGRGCRLAGGAPWALLREKAPLFAVAAAIGLVTVGAQRSIGALMGLETYPWVGRVANALVATVTYLELMVAPRNLAVFYPLPPGGTGARVVAGAAVLLATVSFAAARQARRRPYLAVGWLWYLITLLPVSGLIQVGHQALADRYTYVPLTGLFLMVAWGLGEVAGDRPRVGGALVVAVCVGVVVLAAAASKEAGYWKDSERLMRRALAVTRDNFSAHNNLGTALMVQGRFDEAEEHFERTLTIRPDHYHALLNLGQVRLYKGRPHEAATLFAEALRLQPGSADARRLLNQAAAAP